MDIWKDKELWQAQIVECLAELADSEYQERAWKGGITGEAHSFEECVEMLFSDTNLSAALAAGEVFSVPIDLELRRLEALVTGVNYLRPVTEVLVDPAVAAARPVAAQCLAMILNRHWLAARETSRR